MSANISESQRRYRLANREKINERARKWRESNPGRQAAHMRKWRLNNLEKSRENGRNHYHRNADKHRDKKLRRLFGITAAQYEDLLVSQGHVCAICKGVNADLKRLHVDHCHTTGKVRGLLCNNCNRGIGHLQDSEQILENAAAYLRASR